MDLAATPDDIAHLQRENGVLKESIAMVPLALVGLDGEGRVDLWNAAAASLFGWSAAEVLQKSPPFIAEADLKAHRDGWRGGQGATTIEAKALCKDGSTVDVKMVPAVERGASGEPGRMVIAMTHVERGAAHEAEMNDALRRSEERFRLVTLATQDAIYDFDIMTNAVWRSESFATISGDPGARLADADWWRNKIHPDSREAAFKALEEALAGGRTSWVSEYRLQRLTGEYVTLTDRGVILRDEQGRPVRVIGAVTDVSEQRRLEAQVQESLARLNEAAEELKSKNALLEVEITERARREASLRRQKEEIQMLSAPIMQVWDKVLALPIIGTVDRERSRQIMDKLLGEIVRTQSVFAILDLTGVAHVDTDTLKHLLDIVRAANLLGSATLLSGIAPSIARTMVALGVETAGVTTFGTLEDALAHALRSAGMAGLSMSARGAGR